MKQSRRSLAVLSLITALIFANGVCASIEASEYDTRVNNGRAALKEGKDAATAVKTNEDFRRALTLYGQALDDFSAAGRLEPSNPEPFFFQGATFNRIGELIQDYNKATGSNERGAPKAFCAAVQEINHSIALGMTTGKEPTLLVELAFALLKANDNLRAQKVADQFLSLGESKQELRAVALQIKEEAQKKIDESKKLEPIHICGKAPKPFANPGEQIPEDKRVQSQFLKSITTGIGYNGNVILLGRGLPLPTTTPHKEAFFNESILSLEGDWFFYHNDGGEELVDKLAATYAAIHDAYDELSSSNTLTQTAGLNYCRALSTKTCVGLQLKDAWIRSDTKNISNTLALQPSINYAESEEFTTQISYGIIRSDYSITPRTPLAVLDGFTHQVAIQQTWAHRLREGQWSPQIAITEKYLHQWTLTDGIVGDRQRDNPLLKTEWTIFQAGDLCSVVRSFSLAASYEYRHDQYENATFPTLTAANRFKRRDDTHLVGVALSVKLWYDEVLKNRLEAILEYQSTTNDSNVAAKTYDQPRFVASVKVNF